MIPSFKHIKPLLLTGGNLGSRWFSYIGLGLGVLLIFCSLQMFVNMQQLLRKNATRKNGFDFISIRKAVTNETMGKPALNMFSTEENEELRKQPFIDGAAPLLANNFRIQLSAGRMFQFQTDFFIEAIDNEFIDTVPPSFHWQKGQQTIPLIVSSDFLEIYNVFAPGYELPQVSESTISSLSLTIICFGKQQQEISFQGRIVALSDRINSILVPKSFLDWSNSNFSNSPVTKASRIYLKTKDANNPELLQFLEMKNYRLNKDKTRFGRVKQILQGVFAGLGVFGVMVLVLSLMLFSYYLQLLIASSKNNLWLLLTLGYSPAWLSKKMSQLFFPVYLIVVIISLTATAILQWAFVHYVMYDRAELSSFIHWSLPVLSSLLILMSVITNYYMVKRLLHHFYRTQP
ncbi:MAG: FtsX-like permease family protein [Chitinophagaceae bacterium]